MADFILSDGERILESVNAIALDRKRREVAARLVLTTDRIALCFEPARGVFIGLFGAVGGLFGGMLGGLLTNSLDVDHGNVEQQIAREDFAEVEIDDKWIVVRTFGEGYARTTIAVRVKDPDVWQGRLRRWAAGELSPPQLPEARVIPSD
jgi:hypothetical protein